MDWTIGFDSDHRFVQVTTRGTFALPDHLRMIEAILGQPFWEPGLPVLFDHRQLDMAGVSYETMQGASANHLRNDRRIGQGKAAIVMGSLTDFGRARQFEMLTERQTAARMQVFLDPESARAWLLG